VPRDMEVYCSEHCELELEGSAPGGFRSSDVHTRRMPTQVYGGQEYDK